MFLYTEAVEKKRNIVLIIDEAQTLRLPLLELLRQLINFETNDQKLLQLVLFPQEEFRNKLTHPMARNFRSRVSMASTLDKMGLNEITEMIDFRWRVASGKQAHPFTSDAIQSIYSHSEGIPRGGCSERMMDFSNISAKLMPLLEQGAGERSLDRLSG